jgi:5-methylcytosine-specific restriction endonuclease McrA
MVGCASCGKILYRSPERRSRLKLAFCSLKCMGKKLENKVIVNCSYCHREIKKYTSSINRYQNFFCNKKCKIKFFNLGKTPLQKKIRNLPEYNEWRIKVFKRDIYTCKKCGDKGYIYAHHIVSLSTLIKKYNIKTSKETLLYKEFWDIDNGQTLCLNCHLKTDNYGNFRKS